MNSANLGLSLAILGAIIPLQVNARPDYEHYYVGIDGREVLTFGTYAGLNNPNYYRLTFLSPHIEEDPTSNHFHGIGTYSYMGDVTAPTIIPTNTNNRIPEYFTGLSPIALVPGSGIFADRLITQRTEAEYTNFTIRPVSTLLEYAPNLSSDLLYNSSDSAWQGTLGEAAIALELVSVTPGLKVADETGIDLLTEAGDTYLIGQGDDFSFTPIFYTDKSASIGQYSAEFRLLDVNNTNNRLPLPPSGTFIIDFQVQSVPEPSILLGFGLLSGLTLLSQKRRGH